VPTGVSAAGGVALAVAAASMASPVCYPANIGGALTKGCYSLLQLQHTPQANRLLQRLSFYHDVTAAHMPPQGWWLASCAVQKQLTRCGAMAPSSLQQLTLLATDSLTWPWPRASGSTASSRCACGSTGSMSSSSNSHASDSCRTGSKCSGERSCYVATLWCNTHSP
jgi:hypothetical protein